MSIQSSGNNSQPGATVTGTPVKSVGVSGNAPTPPTSGTVAVAPSTTPTADQVHKSVDTINKSIQSSIPSIEFATDPDSKRMVVKVIDQQTNEVIMQIPNQEVIDMSQSLDKLQGLLVKLKA